MPDDPWNKLSHPQGFGVSARRADPDHRFDFFWALSHDGHCLLIMEYPQSVTVNDKRPKLGEISIVETRNEGEPSRFILELNKGENREIFLQLCVDIIDSASLCADEQSALSTVIRRTWRWHGMLKGGHDEKLGPEKQKGLIGELRVLEVALLPQFSSSDSLNFWHGPTGTPKDFSVGNVSIEAKAKRGASKPFVRISSEDQLDNRTVGTLYLAVTYVDEAASGTQGARTLTEYVQQLSRLIETSDSGSLWYFEARLDEAGYNPEHDYSDSVWIIGDTIWYHVDDDFPKVVRDRLSEAVHKVEYSLDINSCDAWLIPASEIVDHLKGAKG